MANSFRYMWGNISHLCTTAAVGMHDSTEDLNELISRVIGDLVKSSIMARIVDDLYAGGRSIVELLHNWVRIL